MDSVKEVLHEVVDQLTDDQARQTLEFVQRLRRNGGTRFIEEATWRHEFEALLARVQSRTVVFPSEAIEADITAAAHEVKEARRARRGSH